MDSVGDALIRIKNGYLSYKETVVLPYSKLVGAICELLVKEGYLSEFKLGKNAKNANISEYLVTLKYERATQAKKNPAITGVKRISKPGLRIYKGKGSIPYVLNGIGMAIVSTPKGVLSDKQARKQGVGGEIMAYVW